MTKKGKTKSKQKKDKVGGKRKAKEVDRSIHKMNDEMKEVCENLIERITRKGFCLG